MSNQDSNPPRRPGYRVIEKPQPDHLGLGFRFAGIVRVVTNLYIERYGDGDRTRREARQRAYDDITTMYRISQSLVRLYIGAYERFHAMPRAVEFLRQTDMQLLLGADISAAIIEAVIDLRAANPSVPIRAVKELIDRMRHDRNLDAPAG